MMWGYYDYAPGMGLWAIIVSLFWLGLAAIAVWALVRWLSRTSRPVSTPQQPPQIPPERSALEILRVRYASGEIDSTTYESMRERLEADVSIAREDKEPRASGR